MNPDTTPITHNPKPTTHNPKPTMRILLIIIQFAPDVNSTGRLMSQVFGALRERGHEVDVITTFPHYEHFRVWDEYRGKLFERDEQDGMNVLRTWVYASGTKQNMLRRLASYLSFNFLATLAGIFRRRRYDVIFCPNGSFFTGITGTIIGRLKGAPVVYNVQDLYPEVPVRAGQLNSRWAIRGLELLERFMYRVASRLAVITPSFKENIVGKGVDPAKITVIPNFVDTEFIRPLPKDNDFSRKFGLADRFVVSHAGNIGYAYDLDTLLDAAALVAAEEDAEDVLFLIVGDGVAKPELEEKAASMGLDNVRFLGFQPYEDLPWLRAASDVQVSLYKWGSSSYSMPSKVYEIMASGRPLLASGDPDSDVWNLVDATGCGICVEPENAGQLAAAVLTLYHDEEARQAMGRRGRRHAEECYSTEAVVAQYERLLRQIAEAP